MPLPQIKERPNFPVPRERVDVIVNNEKGQKTKFDEDKGKFEAYKFLQNVIEVDGNLEVRNGTLELADITDLLGIGRYETNTEELLMAVVKTGSTSKLSEVNRTTGALTDRVTGITGTGEPDMTSVNGDFWIVNGSTDIVKFTDPSTDSTLALPSSEKGDLITSDESRVWIFSDAGLLRGSDIGVSTFTPSGTNLNRAFSTGSGVTKGISLKSTGDFVCVAGENRIEIHQVPDFARAGLATFPADTKTLVTAYDKIGVKSKNAIIGVAGVFFVKTTDGKLLILVPGDKNPKEILENEGRMRKFTYDQAALGFDQNKDLLIISGRDAAFNNHGFAYHILKKSFSEITRMNAQEFVGFQDNFYYRSSVNTTIQDFMNTDQETDNGISIPCVVETLATYGTSREHFKIATKRLLNLLTFGVIDVLYEFFADQKVGDTTTTPVYLDTIKVEEISSPFGEGMSNFVGGFGMAGYNMSDGSDLYTEFEDSDTFIRKEFWRGWVRISFNASRKISIRSVGFDSEVTTKKVPIQNLS